MAAKKKNTPDEGTDTPATVTKSSSSSEEKVIQLLEGRYLLALTSNGRIFEQRGSKTPWREIQGPSL